MDEKRGLSKWVVFCVIAGIAGVAYLKFKPVVFFGDYLLKILLGVLIIIFMLALNSHVAIGNKVSLFLGSISYEVFLIHGSIFGLMAFIVPEISSGVYIGLSMVISIAVAWIVKMVGDIIIERIRCIINV